MMLFHAFFDRLRAEGVPVSWNEWMMLLEALRRGAAEPDLESFYRLSRAVLVKDEAFYDRFDRAFVIAFKDAEPPAEVLERILAGLQKELARVFTDEEMKALQALPLEQVLANFRKQLEEGHYKGHVGGNKAIGTRGTSTQGADGYNPAGIRIGQDEGRHGKAIKIAEFRRFRNYDSRRTLDTRGCGSRSHACGACSPRGRPTSSISRRRSIAPPVRPANCRWSCGRGGETCDGFC